MRADDVPSEYPDVDEQLLADYPELAPLLARKPEMVDCHCGRRHREYTRCDGTGTQ